MGRYLGPICRRCRREGMKLCDKHKCASVKRAYPPGQHGPERQAKLSDYGKQLREKQKLRRIFGISERQMQKYYRAALKSPEASNDELLRQLERRMDNIIFRSGLARTRRQARQMVSHGIFMMNGRRITVPSYQLEEGETVTVREQKKSSALFQGFEKRKSESPQWIKVDPVSLSVTVMGRPMTEDFEQSVAPHMIIEFYSRN